MAAYSEEIHPPSLLNLRVLLSLLPQAHCLDQSPALSKLHQIPRKVSSLRLRSLEVHKLLKQLKMEHQEEVF